MIARAAFRSARLATAHAGRLAATPALRSLSAQAAPAASRSNAMPASMLLATAGVGLAAFTFASADEKVDYDAVRRRIIEVFDEDQSRGPLFVRLAWHSSGTYCKHSGTGGSDGASMRFAPESGHGANAGLGLARSLLEPIKQEFPGISTADLWVLASIVVIEEMGGPSIKFRAGRTDATSSAACPPDGRLPDAAQGQSHLRDIFYRMGLNDQEIVALAGAHALGECHVDRSGFSGPWTRAPTTFSNEYFRELVENTWVPKEWDGPFQYVDAPTGELMMLPADIALRDDPKFKVWVDKYAQDEDLFFEHFAAAYRKLIEFNVKFPEKTGPRRYIIFGPRDE